MSLLRLATLKNIKLPEMMRKCGAAEKVYLNKSNDCSSGLKHLKLRTKIDFYKNVDLIGDAILEWRNIYPLLNSKILTDSKNDEIYYVHQENKRENVFDNVKLFTCNSLASQPLESNEDKNDKICNMLMEHEFLKHNTSVSLNEMSLLWNLTFLKFENFKLDHGLNQYRYDLCMGINHSIMDDRCLVKVLLKLLNILEMKNLKLNKNYVRQHLLPSINELFYEPNGFKQIDQTNLPKIPNINVPSFINRKNAVQISTKEDINPADNFELKSINEDNNPIKLEPIDLIKSIRKNNSKFKSIPFERDLSSFIIKKCKQEKVRLTSFLNMSMLAAFKLFYAKNGISECEKAENIHFVNHVSLRPYIKQLESYNINELDDFLGYYVNSFYRNVKDQDYESLKSKFWDLTREDDKNLHEKLDSKDRLVPPLYEFVEIDNTKMKHHFELSNIGVINDTCSENGLIKLEKNQSMLAFPSNLHSRLLFNIFFTMNGQINWNLCYNSHFIEEKYVDEIVENFKKVINEIYLHGVPVLDDQNKKVIEEKEDDHVSNPNPNKEISEYFYEMFNKLDKREMVNRV